jgi:glycosyltransferase involved in cell wall biosynthesis
VSKLIVQIPCLNEARTLPATVADIPRVVPGVGEVEILVIDDGSTDDTVRVARESGVDHIVSLRRRQGLASAFTIGIETCIKLGADFIVNTDGDNQYAGQDIVKLVEPLLRDEADIVIGDRNVQTIAEMSWSKKLLQRLGSWIVRQVSNTRVPDTTSGFRAYTRAAALRMTIVSEFSYTLESIIQAGRKRIAIAHVPVRTNPRTRPSRLFPSVRHYLQQSGSTILRTYTMYEPLKVFTSIGLATFAVGFAISLRFLYFYFTGSGDGHLQSLVLSAVLMIVGFQVLLMGLVADVISANRKLIEDVLFRIRAGEANDPRGAVGASFWSRRSEHVDVGR